MKGTDLESSFGWQIWIGLKLLGSHLSKGLWLPKDSYMPIHGLLHACWYIVNAA